MLDLNEIFRICGYNIRVNLVFSKLHGQVNQFTIKDLFKVSENIWLSLYKSFQSYFSHSIFKRSRLLTKIFAFFLFLTTKNLPQVYFARIMSAIFLTLFHRLMQFLEKMYSVFSKQSKLMSTVLIRIVWLVLCCWWISLALSFFY